MFRLRSHHLKKSCFVFQRGFQAPLKNKGTRSPLGLRPRAFVCFLVLGTPDETVALVFDILHK